jgi:phosphotransferase system  glucose/maltose/N-acetylglucosamine-specific IIC component
MKAFERNKFWSKIITGLFVIIGSFLCVMGIINLIINSTLYSYQAAYFILGGISTFVMAFGIHALWDGYAVIVYKAQYGKSIDEGVEYHEGDSGNNVSQSNKK